MLAGGAGFFLGLLSVKELIRGGIVLFELHIALKPEIRFKILLEIMFLPPGPSCPKTSNVFQTFILNSLS